MAEKIDGKTIMGSREATNAEHAQHVEAGFYVARLKGGHKLHLRKMGEDAICGAMPTSKGGWRQMKARHGWETYKQDSSMRATCLKCLDAFVPKYKDMSLDAVLARCEGDALMAPATCRLEDGRCGICGGDWSVCGCDGMLRRAALKSTSPAGGEHGH